MRDKIVAEVERVVNLGCEDIYRKHLALCGNMTPETARPVYKYCHGCKLGILEGARFSCVFFLGGGANGHFLNCDITGLSHISFNIRIGYLYILQNDHNKSS